MDVISSLQDYVQGYVPEAKGFLNYIQEQAEGTCSIHPAFIPPGASSSH
jgi:hypothetical protein